MATSYEALYGLVKIHLDVPYKQWLTDQMDPMEDGDMVSNWYQTPSKCEYTLLSSYCSGIEHDCSGLQQNMFIWLYRIGLNC